MSFCKFSSEYVINNNTNVENLFINEFMPNAPENCVKVYLFGLFACNNSESLDNNLEDFSRILNLSQEDIISSFYYWQELGLVQVLNVSPIEIRYLPIKNSSVTLKKYNKDKFKDFNIQAQEIITGRMITPTEYNEYYYLVESLHIETDALIMIIKYCVDLKGNKIGYNYITTIAKNWAYEGITTCEKVEERLLEQQAVGSDVVLVLKALGSRKKPSIDDYQMFITWKDKLDFAVDVIVYVAKMVKNKGGLNRLNYMLEKYYEMNLKSIKEIEEYVSQESYLYEVAKDVCKNIGVRYENLEVVVETYINNWISLGYDKETLIQLSNYSFKSGIKTLEGLNIKINQFYKLGLITLDSIENYIEQLKAQDANIADVLEKLGIVRRVNKFDREFYKTWVYDWQTNDDVLEYAISISCNKIQPMQFLNKLLSIYHTKNITTVEQAKEEKVAFASNNFVKSNNDNKSKKSASKKEYSKEELNALFNSITEVEI